MGIDFPYFSPPKSPDFGGICPAAAEATRLGAALVGSEEEEWEGGGGRGPARAQVLALSRQPAWRNKPIVAPVHVARQRCHIIAPVSAVVAPRCLECLRGSPVAPHALARQRLLVTPGALARPNGLRGANKP